MKAGDWILGREIGRGGMSVVYEAVDPARGGRCAVKVFDVPEGAYRDVLARKFEAEARLLESLRHPNLVRVIGHGTTDDARSYLAMDFVGEGRTLAHRLAEPRTVDEAEVRRVYADLRSALAYCHAKHVVHADLKAENVLLDADGRAVLSDFGIARVTDPALRSGVGLTTSTIAGNFGTPYVLAPECRKGAKPTPASDVYSFGVLLFKMMTGAWYEGSVRLLSLLEASSPAAAPLVKRMLAAEPERRPADAGRLPERLPTFSFRSLARPFARAFRWFRIAFWILVVLGLIGVALAALFPEKPAVPEAAAPAAVSSEAKESPVTVMPNGGMVIDKPVLFTGNTDPAARERFLRTFGQKDGGGK